MKRALLITALLAAALIIFGVTRPSAPQSEVERNRAFTESMSGVTLQGYSTSQNRPGLSRLERYRIDGITHITGDTWLFRTRLNYSDREIPVPIPLTVRWAGDTPMIVMTDLAIPGVGTFTARVLLYREQYAGTWSGEGHGGQLFGTILRERNP